MSGERIDPVTFEVVWHRLLDITEEMGIKYMRTSGSPILVGAYDASTAICLPSGELVAMGPYITTQGHVMRLIIESVIARRAKQARGIRAGDQYICNDPYLGATHQPDVATVAPFHADGELRAWVGSSGHWLDIGGTEPGGFNMNATTVFDEGLRMPPTLLVEDGHIREDMVELIMNQVREPLVELDLRGQVVSNQAGLTGLAELYDSYGATVVESVMREGIDHVERRLRNRLRSLPDGVWREVQYLDHDGHRPNLRQIVCTVTKIGDHLTIDYTGSDPEVAGFANSAYGGVRAATLSAVSIMLGYDMTWNDGLARCVDIVAPSRTIVTAEYPTPVSMATISAIIVNLNLVFGALSKMLLASPRHHEEAMATWCGTSLGVSMFGVNESGIPTVAPESSHFAGGTGARTYADGVDTGGIIINTTANIPSIEQTEAEYPLLYLFRRQLTDSGGPGRYRGGLSAGVAIAPYRSQSGVETTFAGVGVDTPNAFGLAGGLPGATVRFIRYTGAGLPAVLAGDVDLPADEEDLPGEPEVTPINRALAAFADDDIEYHNWQGGGGYGDPLERDPEAVALDVRRRAVSRAAAAAIYGVVLDDAGGVDAAGTERRREELRTERRATSRPAAEVLDRDWRRPAIDVPPSGRIEIGDIVVVDLDRGVSSCASCGHQLASTDVDHRHGCLVRRTGVEAAGPVRGQDYGRDAVALLQYYCPGCLRQLDVEVAADRGPWNGQWLISAPSGAEELT